MPTHEISTNNADRLQAVEVARETMFSELSQQTVITSLGGDQNTSSALRHIIPFNQEAMGGTASKSIAEAMIATVRAGRELFGVLRVNDQAENEQRFVLTRFGLEGTGAEIVGLISPDDWLEMGSKALRRRDMADIDDQLSGKHFKVKVGASGIIFEDENSLNGTDIMVRSPNSHFGTEWAYQHIGTWGIPELELQDRLGLYRKLDRNSGRLSYSYENPKREALGGETYQGYHHIGPHTRVSGGVDFQVKDEYGKGVIDGPVIRVAETGYEANNYESLYNMTKHFGLQFSPPGTTVTESTAVEGAYQATLELLPYDAAKLKETHQLMRQHDIVDGTMVDLNAYIGTDVGAVCFEQSLAVAKALEMLQARDNLKGKVSIRSSYDWQPHKEDFSGHMWVRYTAEDGTVFIIDPAQKVRGRLVDILSYEEAKPERERTGWHYLEDNESYQPPQFPGAIG